MWHFLLQANHEENRVVISIIVQGLNKKQINAPDDPNSPELSPQTLIFIHRNNIIYITKYLTVLRYIKKNGTPPVCRFEGKHTKKRFFSYLSYGGASHCMELVFFSRSKQKAGTELFLLILSDFLPVSEFQSLYTSCTSVIYTTTTTTTPLWHKRKEQKNNNNNNKINESTQNKPTNQTTTTT